MNLQDTVLEMTVAVVEVARTGRDALVAGLVADGLTEEEARSAVDSVIQVQLAPSARKARAHQLREQGMSQRAIAAELGVGFGTVNRDLAPEVIQVDHDDDVATRAEEPEVIHVDQPSVEQKGEPDADHEFRRQQLPTVIVGNIHGLKVLTEFSLDEIADAVPAHRRRATARQLRKMATFAIKAADHMEKGAP
jgi:hypothetical protein